VVKQQEPSAAPTTTVLTSDATEPTIPVVHFPPVGLEPSIEVPSAPTLILTTDALKEEDTPPTIPVVRFNSEPSYSPHGEPVVAPHNFRRHRRLNRVAAQSVAVPTTTTQRHHLEEEPDE